MRTRASPNETSAAVFLDRDGTIMRDVGYCGDPKQVDIIEGVPGALRKLKENGFKLIVITNQSGLGRGYFTEADYQAVAAEVNRRLGLGLIDATYFCPDKPENASPRRKPAPGMIMEAQTDLNLDLGRSFFVGDKAIDVECGRNAGVRTIRVQTGEQENKQDCAPDWLARDLAEAAEIILDASKR